MKTKYLDFLNEEVDYSESITNNKLTIENIQIDLKDLATEKYKDLTDITIYNCTVLNQDTNFSIFQNLKTLYCENNQLTKLPDLSKCSQLERLECHNNQLTTLPDLLKCMLLEKLNCSNNQLTTLPDLSNCSKLKKLSCSYNQLTKLPDLSMCSQLKTLYCQNNQLTSLPDLSNCSQLNTLYCHHNQLTTLPDLSNCSQLKWLDCENNQLTTCKSFYSVYSFHISNNPIPQIEVYFVKNVNDINDYYFDLFNYCVGNNSPYEDFMEIEWPEDFYDNYISKVTTPTQKKYIGYLKHSKDVSNLNDDLFSF